LPGGSALELYEEDPGYWRGDIESLDPADLTLVVPGVYTITARSTDGSADFVTQVDISTLTADPADFPVLTGPQGDTTDRQPTIAWNAIADPNVTGIYASIETADDNTWFETAIPPGLPSDATSVPVPDPMPFGQYRTFVAAAVIQVGTTTEGVSWAAFRYKGSSCRGNIIPFLVTGSLDANWVYQNTATTTLDRHASQLTLAVADDPDAPQGYGALLAERGCTGRLTPQATGNPLVWSIRGARTGAATSGTAILDVMVRGNSSEHAAPATVTLALRRLGDINGDGAVTAEDKLEMNKKLNGLANLPGIGLRELDLTGDGATVTAEDKLVINQILNGLTVP
jgi:hypothetical protein